MLKHFTYEPSDTPGKYEVCYGTDATELKNYAKPFIEKHSSFVYIIDQNLPESILKTVVEITGVPADAVVKINPAKKDIERVISIWDHMVKSVPSAAIVVGGGTTGDISGLACGTYQRGIPRIYFPTTALSMVDASIGGKSGIDHTDVKNSIGVLHYPEAVINYVPFLDTLDDGEYYSGFAEVIKAAVLYDEAFFAKIEGIAAGERLAYGDLIEALYESSVIKAKICEEPNNKKIRLLYGHAVGHAYEKLTDGKKRHGDCVAIGMHVEGALAVLAGYWKEDEWKRQAELIRKFNLPIDMPMDTDLDELIAKMAKYKKLVEPKSLLFVLPDRIGHVVDQDKDCRVRFSKTEIKELLQVVQEFTHGGQ
jgi:3-dehydroquinate synthetase